MKSIILLVLGFSLTNCVTSMQTQPDGYAAKKVLSKSTKKILDHKEILSNLSRSFFHKSDIYSSLYVEAILKTPISEYQKLKSQYKNEKITKSELTNQIREIKSKFERQVCFDLLVKTNDSQALKGIPWDVSLLQGKKKLTSMQVTKFEEKTAKSIFATVMTNFSHVNDDMQYFLETSFCFDKSQKFNDQLVLTLAPEFNKEVDEIRLSWWFN